MGLFDAPLSEVEQDGVRYILRRNPARQLEIARNRREKLDSAEKFISKQNQYLQEHPRASETAALEKARQKIETLRIHDWVKIEVQNRVLRIDISQPELDKKSLLDGGYVIKTDLPREAASAETVNARYKDLAEVERAFRTEKTGLLEIRPVNVRKESHTEGHVLVVMLAYLIVQELSRLWRDLNLTVEEGLDQLKNLCTTAVLVKGELISHKVPQPNSITKELLEKAGVSLPDALPIRKVKIYTKHKLQDRRVTR